MGPWCRRRPGIRRPLKENAAGWLLTHHQPCGWSPALVKGGYRVRGLFALVPYYISSKISSEKHNIVSIITMDAKRQPENIPALCVGCYTLMASGPLFFAQGRLPVCLYPPFVLAAIRSRLPGPWFLHKDVSPCAYIRPLRWLLYPRGFRALVFFAQGRLPVCLYPPFSRAGDRCACAMVVD